MKFNKKSLSYNARISIYGDEFSIKTGFEAKPKKHVKLISQQLPQNSIKREFPRAQKTSREFHRFSYSRKNSPSVIPGVLHTGDSRYTSHR